jgi:hypothetical protein
LGGNGVTVVAALHFLVFPVMIAKFIRTRILFLFRER